MGSYYGLLVTIHLLCALTFVGAVFFEVLVIEQSICMRLLGLASRSSNWRLVGYLRSPNYSVAEGDTRWFEQRVCDGPRTRGAVGGISQTQRSTDRRIFHSGGRHPDLHWSRFDHSQQWSRPPDGGTLDTRGWLADLSVQVKTRARRDSR